MDFDLQLSATNSEVGRATRDGEVELLKVLLARGASVRISDNRGFRPIHFAAEGHTEYHIECLKILSKHKDTDINWQTHDLQTPLGIAIHTENPYPKVRLLLEAGANPMISCGHLDLPIFKAIEKKQHKMMNLILRYYKEGDIDRKSDHGITPLHAAVDYGCPKSVELLLKHGASIAVRDLYGANVLLASFRSCNIHQKHTMIDIFFHHIEKKGTKFTKEVVNAQEYSGHSCLHEAAFAGCLSCVTRLLNYGADPMLVESRQHHLPFHEAVRSPNDSCDVLNKLQKYTNMYIIRNHKEFQYKYACPLICAIKENRYLLALPLNPNDCVQPVALNEESGKEYEFDTALSVALRLRQVQMVKDLLDAGADVNPTDECYDHPLLAAVSGGSKYLCDLIISRNPRINMIRNGKPICLQMASTHSIIFRYLLYRGANPNFCSKLGVLQNMLSSGDLLATIEYISILFKYLGHNRMINNFYKQVKLYMEERDDQYKSEMKTKYETFQNLLDNPVSLQKLGCNVVRLQLFTARINKVQSIDIPDLRNELKRLVPSSVMDRIFENDSFIGVENFFYS